MTVDSFLEPSGSAAPPSESVSAQSDSGLPPSDPVDVQTESDVPTEGVAGPSFNDLGLSEPVLAALQGVGYEAPSPIQAETVPILLEGSDLIGQAQTGTGKTGAFAWPLLCQIEVEKCAPQALVLCPTRELAIQVAEAFQRYAQKLPGFHVLPIYGGQAYGIQLRALQRGPHVIVGTPGRVMDHMRKGTLNLSSLKHLVLDEADEMLNMGFLEDIQWILEEVPTERQIAMFSATMPREIQRIAEKYLRNPRTIKHQATGKAADTIRQRAWIVDRTHKLDALTRILEVEETDALIVFVRTKSATVELSERLQARGYASAPLNGDIQQSLRERTVERLKAGKLDILIATDVAARGLDVQRISHVINYDMPTDPEAYIHRIGRTGRAGRAGEAILFASNRERRMLRTIDYAVGQKIEPYELPTTDDVNAQRVAKFKKRIDDRIEAGDLEFFSALVSEYSAEKEVDPTVVAAALASMSQSSGSFLLSERTEREDHAKHQERQSSSGSDFRRGDRFDRGDRPNRNDRGDRGDRYNKQRPGRDVPGLEPGMERFRVEVGRTHGVMPGQLVGAIAGETGLEGRLIGRIELYDDFTTVDLPEGMPGEVFKILSRVNVCGQGLRISRLNPAQVKALSRKTY